MAENSHSSGRNAARQDLEEEVTPRIMVLSSGYYFHLQQPEPPEKLMEVMRDSTKQGYAILKQEDGRAVDAVEKTVTVLENSKYFNAGLGSFLNKDGEVECDAMIMDGNTLKTGAVMAARHFKNPVLISRQILEKSPHCALTGDGAYKFASDENFETCDPKSLIQGARKVEENFNDYIKRMSETQGLQATENSELLNGDTVAAVAMDRNGHFACALSTGGLPGKPKGRVGDVPLVGCGGYANEFGAAATSGHGEALMRMTLAREVVYDMEKLELDAQTSASAAVTKLERSIRSPGAVIAIDRKGNFGKATNLPVILWTKMVDDMLESHVEMKEKVQSGNRFT